MLDITTSDNGRKAQIESDWRYQFNFETSSANDVCETFTLFDKSLNKVIISMDEMEELFFHIYDGEKLIEKRTIDGTHTIKFFYNENKDLVKTIDTRLDEDYDFPYIIVTKYTKEGKKIIKRLYPDVDEIDVSAQ